MKKSILKCAKFQYDKDYEIFIDHILSISDKNKIINKYILEFQKIYDNDDECVDHNDRNKRIINKVKFNSVSYEINFNTFDSPSCVNFKNRFLISTDTSDMCIVFHNGNIQHPSKFDSENLINIKLKSL